MKEQLNISTQEGPVALMLRTAESSALQEHLRDLSADAFLLDMAGEPKGLFEALHTASRSGRTLFPGRWLPARRPNAAGQEGRLFWIARNDLSLRRLLNDDAHSDDFVDAMARPDDSLALLGIPGDVLHTAAGEDPAEIQRQARAWLRILGSDRVAIAIPWGTPAALPLQTLAQQSGLPAFRVVAAEDPRRHELSASRLQLPLLLSEFQLDAEHRLPDESYVPGVRDLLHRASLLRERSLYERLPAGWCDHAEAELRALYAWHVSPLLRRAAALVQSILPVQGVQLHAPLPELRGVSAYLLGLTDVRPDAGLLAEDPTAHARAMALALQGWDRSLHAVVDGSSWNALAARLAPWSEGGHLALCEEQEFSPANGSGKVYHLCFSGQPLWLRTPMLRSRAGMPLVPLSASDRRALGWFDLRLESAAAHSSDSATASEGDAAQMGSVAAFPVHGRVDEQPLEQLPLQLEGTGA